MTGVNRASRPTPLSGARTRAAFAAVMALAVSGTLASCGGGGGGGTQTLTWYTNPDNGGQEALAERCTEAADGAYRIDISELPADASDQREQLVRRLAANDSSIDLMSLDVVFVPEFAEAGFLRPFSDDEAAGLTRGVLDGPVETVMWDDKVVAAPFWANTQLLWYRRSVAERPGIDPADGAVTWDEVIDAADQTGTKVAVTGGRYEGYMVWINALVMSAGGEVLQDPDAGKDANPELESDAGRAAPDIIHRLATTVADPALSTAIEENARATFQGDDGGLMVNWPYVYSAAAAAVDDGSLDPAVFDDIAWARFPQVEPGVDSAPPLGGSTWPTAARSGRRPDGNEPGSAFGMADGSQRGQAVAVVRVRLADREPGPSAACLHVAVAGRQPLGGLHGLGVPLRRPHHGAVPWDVRAACAQRSVGARHVTAVRGDHLCARGVVLAVCHRMVDEAGDATSNGRPRRPGVKRLAASSGTRSAILT